MMPMSGVAGGGGDAAGAVAVGPANAVKTNSLPRATGRACRRGRRGRACRRGRRGRACRRGHGRDRGGLRGGRGRRRRWRGRSTGRGAGSGAVRIEAAAPPAAGEGRGRQRRRTEVSEPAEVAEAVEAMAAPGRRRPRMHLHGGTERGGRGGARSRDGTAGPGASDRRDLGARRGGGRRAQTMEPAATDSGGLRSAQGRVVAPISFRH